MKKKKKREAEIGMGYCPFSACARSRYNRLYRDTTRLGMARRQRAGAHHDMAQQASTRPVLSHDTARPRHDAQCAWLEAGSRYKICIMAERGQRWCRDTAQQGTTRPTTRQQARYDMVLGAREAGARPATRRARLVIRPRGGLRHSASARHDTARDNRPESSAPGLCAVLATCAHRLRSGCAPGAPNLVLTQCTVLSHRLGHCL